MENEKWLVVGVSDYSDRYEFVVVEATSEEMAEYDAVSKLADKLDGEDNEDIVVVLTVKYSEVEDAAKDLGNG